VFKAISYGWNGRTRSTRLDVPADVMGPTLAQVEPIRSFVPYMDLASQTGRVRPIWQAGFAGSLSGFRGDPNTWYESPDVAQVLQQVVDRPNWAAGNTIVVLCASSSYEEDRRFWAYDGAPDKAARLKITYQPK
jgi:hypothetical protein